MSELSKQEKGLDREGWKLASTTGGEHLKRTLEMYKELGIKIKLLKIKPEYCIDCKICFTSSDEDLYKVYIKPDTL